MIWYVYNDKYSGQQYVFGTDEVLHFKTSHSLDGITGLPVQAILKTTVEGAAASQDYLNSLYESGLTGKATLEYTGDLNKDLKEKQNSTNNLLQDKTLKNIFKRF